MSPTNAKTEERTIKLSKVELKAMLDAKIRRRAGWELRGYEVSGMASLGVSFDDESIKKASRKVHDDIVADFSYSDSVITAATRSVKNFGVAYVRKVIRAAVKSGALAEAVLIAEGVKRGVAEAVACKTPGRKIRSKGKGRGKGRGKGKGPMGVPYGGKEE